MQIILMDVLMMKKMLDILMLMLMMMITSSKNARPVCESSRERARHHSLRLGSEHTPYTPDHHDYADDVDDDDNVYADDGEGNDQRVERRRGILPGSLNIEGLQHTCWKIWGGWNYDGFFINLWVWKL